MNIHTISFTQKGAQAQARLHAFLLTQGERVHSFSKKESAGLTPLQTDVCSFAKEAFAAADALVFIGAAGIAVRAIAPFVRDKAHDPAVVVVDDTCRYVIPLLCGHLGGANLLAQRLADFLGAQAVITTATDCSARFAVDSWAVEQHCTVVETARIKAVSAAILAGEPVGFVCDAQIQGALPRGLCASLDCKVGIVIAADAKSNPFPITLHLIPRTLVLGIGCRKGIPLDCLTQQIDSALAQNALAKERLCRIASIDLKKEEPSLLAFCRQNRLEFVTYSAQELQAVEGDFTPSGFVQSVTGVDNVCERAAVKAGGSLLQKKLAGNGVTVAIAALEWRCCF